MARVRTVEFLPEIFQTSTNQQFLGATLDQLVQEPSTKKIQGFVGRRVGPGVNANDKYVTESSAQRQDYQLEPGVIVIEPDTNTVKDSITYPGIIDALDLQGAITNHADKLYTSEYYTWDPFVDFDKFVNFSQYYWLPGGPDSVNVFAESVPTTGNFVVTRENGVYTFSGVAGNNPRLTLVRQGNYTFQVAQNAKETVNFRVQNQGTNAYIIDYINNPTLTLTRGNTYVFNLILRGDFPFYIKTEPTLGTTNQYTSGVTNNGAIQGNVYFTVPQDAPDTLYYVNSTQSKMRGTLNIVDAVPGTGPGFWIQSDPGVNGRLPYAPNISSRDVYGVVNNGEDLGTVGFNVPTSTAQSFYYSLTDIGRVDLITSLRFDQINNVFLDEFLAANPDGIDGTTNLNGKTLIILSDNPDPEGGGWQNISQFDPLAETPDNNGRPGSFDSLPFSQSTDILPANQNNIWQIQYVTAVGGGQYLTLTLAKQVNQLEKFTIQYGTVYASTQWYKDAESQFQQIPLLTAIKNELWYQDGTDPEIFGRIKLVDQDRADQLDIDEILGQKNYTSPNGVVFTNGLKVTFVGSVNPTSYQNQTYYVEGVGTAIQLLSVENFVTPETYTESASIPYDSTGYDVGNYDASLNQPLQPDYLTINLASPDLNPWTRSNRWFHIDVINASAEYNNVVPVLNNEFRGRRPILEFRAGTKLFNFGTQGKQPVDIIDFATTNALAVVNGSLGYGVDGYSFINGTRVIFAADTDDDVRNKIYVVEFIVPQIGNDGSSFSQPIINLVPATDSEVLINQTVVCLSGITLQGKSFWYDGVEWLSSQQKTGVNQAPLFDVYDAVGVSFSNRAKYPSSNFIGSKLFSYAQGTGTKDLELGFALRYLSLANVGDIVFDNNLYTDTFTYTIGSTSNTENISLGYARQYSDRVIFVKEIGWQPAAVKSQQRQQFQFSYDGKPLLLDVKVDQSLQVPGVLIYVGAKFQEVGTYTVATTTDSTTITLLGTHDIGSLVEVNVISDQASKVAFYNIPINLENNPLNENSPLFTLGTIRAHYETIGENLLGLQGPINGANNTRDLGNIIPYGTNILQQSSPMTLAGYFMRSEQYNIFNSLQYNSREYEKFKAQFLDNVIRNDYTNYTIPDMLTAVITDMIAGRTSQNPFYWSDMLPSSSIYTQQIITYTVISIPEFDLNTTYDFTSSNYQSLLVYVNDRLLITGIEYEVSVDSPRLTILIPLTAGDVITINEYATTYGTFVPNTPTKLGLYPAFVPKIFVDTSYIEPTLMIQGHDGSLTVGFGDFRDQLLLEFELRIYNNLKIKSAVPLPEVEVIPGQFRTTDYSLSNINQILAPDFLSWIGWNKLNYQQQTYVADNSFTWNYSASGNRLTGNPESNFTEDPMPAGAWRGIYQYFYDTATPQSTPWEMLGLTIKPIWWEEVYGPAPYTSTNLVLWDDLELGKVADPIAPYFRPEYARPGLTSVIPVNSEGQLLSPFDSVVGMYDSSQFQKSWVFGDQGPTEYSWRKSSSYPFSVMRLLALTRPAEFFSLFADRDLYKFDLDYDQYLYEGRYRLNANGIQVYGNGTSKASYINWIVDYNQQMGLDSTTVLTKDLANLDVRLCYRMGSFTDKQYLKIYAEKSSPNSLNSGLLLPDESYNILIYKNQPFERVVFSSVILQVVEDGYAIYGYSITNPYFEILASKTAGTKIEISAGGTTVRVPNQYSNDVIQVPYGYVFTNSTAVVDFLLSYGALLTSQGLVFGDRENGHQLDWNQMAQEFLYWSAQGWDLGSVINLNPCAFSLTAVRDQAIVDSILAQTPENLLLDQNRTNLPVRDLVVDRQGNRFTVTSLSQQTISYLDLKYTSYESMVILDNVSLFNDLIYSPVTGARQSRVNIAATVSADWNGQLDAQGFIYNNPRTIKQWQPSQKYAKGEIVTFKNVYWSAQDIVQPSIEFDVSKWVKSDYNKIQKGMLQNIPSKANQLANSYNTNQANLETDQDLVAYGLIGFRPRQYMAALNLDDISQVNVYQQFLKTKGTLESVKLIGNASFNKEKADYDIFENWAVQRGVYGANANRSFIELRLNEALLRSDPSVIQIVEPQQQSQADQTILLQDVWRESYKLTNTDILPTTLTVPTDISLPSAGYVNLDDVDITVFSLDARLSLSPGVIDTIGNGTTIWAAKSNTYDWNVYRCSSVPGFIRSFSSNLNGTATITFTNKHGLILNNIFIVRYFDAAVDGVYRVLGVPTANTIVVESDISTNFTSTGVAFVLQTMRVQQASDVVNLPYSVELIPGARAWVDNDGTGRWVVLEKQSPFTSTGALPLGSPVLNSGFGTSIAQGQNNIIALIGSPSYESTGAVYSYIKDNENQLAENNLLVLGATGTLGYGNAVTIGDQVWGAAGASASASGIGYTSVIYRGQSTNSFEQRQLLVAPDWSTAAEFGYSVTVSQDERWMYIGSPGKNQVYAYGRVEIPEQTVKFTTSSTQLIYSFGDSIEFDPAQPTQLTVVLNNEILTNGYDYTVNANSLILGSAPLSGQILIISRRTGVTLDDKTYYSVDQDATSGSGTGALFTINNTRGNYSVTNTSAGVGYAISDTLTIFGTNLGTDNSDPNSPTNPANNLVITVVDVNDDGGIIDLTFTGSGITNNYIFPLDAYLYTVTDINSFTVTVDGILQRPYIDYEFNTASALYQNELVFNTVPSAGSSIVVSSKEYFTYVDTLTVAGLAAGARFGSSVTTTTDGRQIMIGAISDDSDTVDTSGSVYVFDRSVTRYVITDPTDLTYALPAAFQEPVNVLLNNQFLTNSQQYINGDFSVVGTNVVLNSSTVTLAVGDVLELESNIFRQVQKLTADQPFDEAQYGYSVDVCPNNCSVYIGSPYDGSILSQAGSVERQTNQARIYGVITATVANPTLTVGDTISINNISVAVPASPNQNVAGLAAAINSAGIDNVQATVNNGLLTISVINLAAADEFNRLSVLPGITGSAFEDLGFELFVWTQTIVSPYPTLGANFGSAVFIDSEADNLIIGAPRGDLIIPEAFDQGTTYFDDRSTRFYTPQIQSGVVYSYDYLPATDESILNPGKFVFGQQIYDTSTVSLDQWGTAVNYTTGRLLVGAPGNDLGDSSLNYGRVAVFENIDRKPAWTAIHIQVPTVDVYLLNSVFMYDKITSSKTYFFDFINPLQGKILGAARSNIDYIGAVDPAKYNIGTVNNNGNFWASDRVGQIWWDTSSVRFIDPNQDDLVYASRRWAQVFPGSRIEVYQWIKSDLPPATYTGPGTPLDLNSYTVNSKLNRQGIFTTEYFFWVSGIDTIATNYGKTLSTTGIARYIESPRSSGIPYIAAIDANTIAIYNGLEYISAQDTILHVEYDREFNDDNIHVEFELIAQDRPDSFLNPNLYRKWLDSFCGVNTTGAKVPDPTLSPPERYGVEFRPRQSMFDDRFAALENYLTYVNKILKDYPIAETRKFNLLNSGEPEPTVASGEWNKRLANIEQLSYQDLYEVPLGYRYLVVSDSTNSGLWAIYNVIQSGLLGAPRITQLYRVQTYDTRKYWNYINWYLPGYNISITPVAEVPNYATLNTLTSTVAVGSSVKVTANAQGKFEIYLRTLTGWDRVGLEDGTIEIKAEIWDYAIGRFGFDVEVFDAQYFDQEPTTETRKIIQAINQELLIGDLSIERNRALILTFNFVLSEFTAPTWLTKTSLIDVEHRIRELIPYQIYRQDNQTFVLDYLQEVKPYHVQVREFNLAYDGQDSYQGYITDFDNPSYYNQALTIPQYINPVLLPYTKSTAVGTGTASDIADTPADAQIWVESPWKEWYSNYLLSLQEVIVENPGQGYSVAPTVVVTGECLIPAELEAVVNSAGQVVSITVINPGQGYLTTAVITFDGGNGIGVQAYAVMGNDLVRSVKTTMKYDRYQYQSTIVDWEPNVNYDNGVLVRYNDQVWAADNADSTAVESATFDPEQWTRVNADSLSGVDRTMGFYLPTPNEPGLELPLLIDGVTYPGVQVKGLEYNANSGFDVGAFDTLPFDNVVLGPEGYPTYDPGLLDAIYESSYLDPFLGTRPTDINVEGGGYIDVFSSYAPEELVPGSEFDTLDFRVYTRPGSDWSFNGHGFRTSTVKYILDITNPVLSFIDQLPYPIEVQVANQTNTVDLYPGIDYEIDWVNQTVTMITGNNNDIITLTVYGLGGGNQLYRNTYIGNEIVGNEIIVPVAYNEIFEFAIFVNGQLISNYTFEQYQAAKTKIIFSSSYTNVDYISITAIGPTVDRDGSTITNYSWSTPQTQYFVSDGSTLVFDLSNNLEYTNQVNLIVTVSGIRARTAAGAEYYGDNTTIIFDCPSRLGFSQALIADNEVFVYVNDIQLIQGVDYVVDPYIGNTRTVTLTSTPDVGERILISVTTKTQCYINSGQLVFDPTQGLVPNLGESISVTTWNDTRQQNILTQVFVGPVPQNTVVSEGYDITSFDFGDIADAPGSFDYSTGTVISANDIQLGRVVTDPSRLYVTFNGRGLFYGDGFTISGEEMILTAGVMSPTDTLMITQFTESTVPEAMAFRIFQDMRGVQATYRITDATTTELVDSLEINDDVIFVANASALSEPNLVDNIWGILTINGERIMYRNRDTVLNTISGLRRGTAGTGVDTHAIGSAVYDMGRGNLLPIEYQNYVVSNTILADGSTTTFVAEDINLSGQDSTLIDESVEVYVGGIRQFGGYSIIADDPATVLFNIAPPNGVDVTILQRRGVTWYQKGVDTASNGIALQDTNTKPARFLRGL